MHLYDLPEPLRSSLLTTAVGHIRPVILIAASTKTALLANTGQYALSSTYQFRLWQDTLRLLDSPVQLSASKPVLPNDGQAENLPRATEVSLAFNNTDTHFATTQVGAMLEAGLIEQAEFQIFAQVDGQTGLLPLYRGRAVGLPQEEFGRTIVTIRDSLWDLVRKPVLYGKLGQGQQTQVVNNTLVHSTITIGTGSSQVELYDGIVAFAEDGQALTTVTNTDPDKIVLKRIVLNNGALPGKYTIEFTSSTQFKVTYPDNEFLTGSITTLYPGALNPVNIAPGDWEVQQVPDPNNPGGPTIPADPKGTTIEFYVSTVMKGNPVAIIELLLEWGLTDGWGNTPVKPATLPVDWQAFADVRQAYSGFTVYVDSTNRDNSVWLLKRGSKPQNILALCQQIADHIGAQVTVDNFGWISLTAPGVFPRQAHLLSDAYPTPAIEELRIVAQERSNYFLFKYGFNSVSQNSAAVRLYDERVQPTDEKVEQVINLPFFKQNVNLWEVESISGVYMDRILRSFVRLEMRVKPNWALAIVPGDRFHVVTTQPPVVDMYVEVYSVDKSLGGIGIVRAVKIEEPRVEQATFCTSRFCVTTFC